MTPLNNDDIFKPADKADIQNRKIEFAKSKGAWVVTAHRELQEVEGVDIAITEGGAYTTGVSMESHTKGRSGETEWVVFANDEDAEQAAIDQVKDDLDANPDYFNEDFITQFIFISDTDRRIMAGDEADSRMEGMDEREILESTGNEQDYDEASEVGNEIEMERILEEAKEQLQEKYYDEIYAALDDPIQYFVKDQGSYTIGDLLKSNWIQIHSDAAAEAAIDADGVAHFLDRYDGKPIELPSGAIAYGTN
jgi:hypothetical protein